MSPKFGLKSLTQQSSFGRIDSIYITIPTTQVWLQHRPTQNNHKSSTQTTKMDASNKPQASLQNSKMSQEQADDDWQIIDMPTEPKSEPETPQEEPKADNTKPPSKVDHKPRGRRLRRYPVRPAPLPPVAWMTPMYAGIPDYTIPSLHKSPRTPRCKKPQREKTSLELLNRAEKAILRHGDFEEISLLDDDEYVEWSRFMTIIGCIAGAFLAVGIAGLFALGMWWFS
ncbi:hypothetical protein Slin15195_G016930 [Septoria linicola]|uniref:Uncharacterized protein n=1 Tax=Septoria linicola TaxID=215465 RepID=A0A9Q9EFY8_9PEZI|nr:hypothetical protein Slin14017_G016990 [Septoria linicola]USW48374.1 hypothetical protein Slin15195_G016930 [Septoria linicola]